MSAWEHHWPDWEPSPESGNPAERGGCTQSAANEAGMTKDPGAWVQEVDISDPRLDAASDEYDWYYAALDAFVTPDGESARKMKPYEGWSYRGPDREPPDWEAEPF
jgi:hypothetical protein